MEIDSGEVVIPCGLEIEGTPLEAPFTQEEMEMLNAKLTTLNLNFFPLDKFSPLPIAFARYETCIYVKNLQFKLTR